MFDLQLRQSFRASRILGRVALTADTSPRCRRPRVGQRRLPGMRLKESRAVFAHPKPSRFKSTRWDDGMDFLLATYASDLVSDQTVA
jgi:hypothetical protein